MKFFFFLFGAIKFVLAENKITEKRRIALETFQLLSLLCKQYLTKQRKTLLFVVPNRYWLAGEIAVAGTYYLLALLGNSKFLCSFIFPEKEARQGNSSNGAHKPHLTSLEKGKDRAGDFFTCYFRAVRRLWKSRVVLSLCSAR